MIEEEEIIQERKEKALNILKTKINWITYAILAAIVFIAVRIRISNLDGLRDISTGAWTLGPDLDPFLFTRMAGFIVENGTLFANDVMRYVPIGFETNKELILHPYMIAWFHKLATLFGSESIIQSAAIYPAFMFAFTVIAFFLLTRKIFVDSLGKRNANIIALISSFFLSVMPVILPRTISGIPEKESGAFLFMFLAFYFFLTAWKAKTPALRYSTAFLAGISTAAMALVWGGFAFIFVTLGMSMFIAFLVGSVNLKKFYTYAIWLFTSFILMGFFSIRYPFMSLVTSVTTGIAFVAFIVSAIHIMIFKTKIRNYFLYGRFSKIPKPIISLIISAIIAVILSAIFFGPGFIFDKIGAVKSTLITPTTNRLGVTVAENRQPYFDEWSSNFGPRIKEIPLFFWLFFFGSIYLFNHLAKVFEKRERIIITLSYTLFLFAIIFSRYKPTSSLNGTNTVSLLVYAVGFLALIGAFGYYYYKYYKLNREDQLMKLDFGLVLLFSLFFLSIVSARGAVRLIMMLVPPTSIIVSYFAVSVFSDAKKVKDDLGKIIVWILVGIIILSTGFAGIKFYQQSDSTAKGYVPSVYTQQWQKAMSWVRENTPSDAVFGHWWDYGYWLQSIGERATVLDGGNAVAYWNHFMGRYALTGTSNLEAVEFLYAHNTTHFLIDSTDIGKYSAFSSIGSDVNYDRQAWMPTFLRDDSQVLEKKDSTVYLFQGGTSVDEDIIYYDNGSKIFLPKGKAGVGAVTVEVDKNGKIISQPEGIFVYQDQQYRLPLRYAYDGEFKDYEEGVEAGIYLMPRLDQTAAGGSIIQNGASIYLSSRTVKSQVARLYLYKEQNQYFNLVYNEDDLIIEQLKTQSFLTEDIIYYQGVRGPIRIWEINYPSNIQLNQSFLETNYPEELNKV